MPRPEMPSELVIKGEIAYSLPTAARIVGVSEQTLRMNWSVPRVKVKGRLYFYRSDIRVLSRVQSNKRAKKWRVLNETENDYRDVKEDQVVTVIEKRSCQACDAPEATIHLCLGCALRSRVRVQGPKKALVVETADNLTSCTVTKWVSTEEAERAPAEAPNTIDGAAPASDGPADVSS